jgi:nitronate monooxygenase
MQCFAPTIVSNNGTTNVDLAHSVNAKFIAQVGSIKEAKMALQAGVDGIIAQGSEAGGHGLRRELGNATFPLTSQVRQLTDIPVIAAGGISTGQSVAAALCICDGAVLGTRLWASVESIGSPVLQAELLDKSCDDVTRTTVFDEIVNSYASIPWPEPFDSVGALKNETTAILEITPDVIQDYKKALKEGNTRIARVLAGEGVGEIDSIEPAFSIISRIEQETEQVLKSLSSIVVD